MSNILLIPRIEIHNANALSSPYTIGFPAMTAWLGAVHALERKLRICGPESLQTYAEDLETLEFKSVAVICHEIRLHTYRGANDYVSSIVGTGNPLDKSGNRPSFIEEARCDLTVSLLVEYEADDTDSLEEAVTQLLKGQTKMAGGDIIRFRSVECLPIDNEQERKNLMGRVMPGHCLVERRDLMRRAMSDGQDGIDALLDYLKVSYTCSAENEKAVWSKGTRKEKGWIVPIATGFHGISELGHAEHQRDQDTPHRFVESVVTLGEFVMPYRITDIDMILWGYDYDADNQLYLCQPKKTYTNLLNSKEAAHG